MIALKNHRPVLQSGHCVFSDYDRDWFDGILQEAADRAGVPLPFREEIVNAIMLYLETACPLNSLPIDYLFRRIRLMLANVGLTPLARHLREQTPPVEIPLDHMASRAPMPLFFFTALKTELDHLKSLGLNTYNFSGKKQCVLAMEGGKRWNRKAQALLEELDSFLEQEASA